MKTSLTTARWIAGFFALAVATRAQAASSTAMASATVLGSASVEIAAGAVAVERVGTTADLALTPGMERQTVARFRVRGGQGATYSVALPAQATLQGAGASLQAGNFKSGSLTHRLSADGTGTFAVEALVSLPAGQAPGQYAGTFPVTIAYD